MGRIVGLLVVLAVVAGGGWYLWRHPGAIPWLAAERPHDLLRLYGNIDLREARPAFNLAGRIASMELEEGDEVTPGRLLATLEDTVFRAREAAARAALEAARARLAKLEAGSRPQEIARARAELERLRALARDAELTVERLRRLAADRFAPKAQLDSAEARLAALRAQIRAQQQTLELLIEGPRKEDIAAARAEVARLEAELAIATKQLTDTRLVADVHGVVTARLQEAGNVVLPHAPVYTIALEDTVYARVYVEEPWLGRLQEGMKARILTDSGGVYEGWVGYISPVAEFTPKTVQTEELRTSLVYQLRVYARNRDGGLRQGMPVTVEIPLAPSPAP